MSQVPTRQARWRHNREFMKAVRRAYPHTPPPCIYCRCEMVYPRRGKRSGNLPKGTTDPKNMATVDHIVAVRNGGENTTDNMVLCCALCNSRKGHMTVDEFLGWLLDAAS